jgi:hypothetical protein
MGPRTQHPLSSYVRDRLGCQPSTARLNTSDSHMRHRGGHASTVALAFAMAVSGALLPSTTQDVVAASCNGASHPAPTLSNGRASPSSGTPSTTITFSVRYVDSVGCAPSRLEVIISGLGRYRMRAGGTAFASGVTFRYSRRLPAGRWSYRFTTVSGSGPGERSATFRAVSPTRVVIKKPASSSPRATPRPTAKPRSGAKATPRPTPTPRPAAGSTATVAPSESPDGQAVVAVPGRSPGPGDGQPKDLGSREHTRRSPPEDDLALSVFRVEPTVGLVITAWSLTSALGVMVFALGLMPVRRRRGPDDPRWRLRPAGAFRTAVQPARSASAEPITSATSPAESIRLPWLLSSSDSPNPASEAGQTVAREPLRFREPARPGVERRAIAYRFIRVTDQPDDKTSAEVCRLDRGDEIEIIGEHDGFLQVRTPNGLQGWVQRMVIVG